MRRLVGLSPGIVVLILTWAVLLFASEETARRVNDDYAFVLYAVGVALAVTFRRSRIAIAAAALALTHFQAGREPDLRLAYGCALLVLLGLLHLTRDRGVFSKPGGVQAGVAALLATAAGLLLANPERADAFASMDVLPDAPLAWTGAPDVVILAAAASLALGAWGLYRWGGPVDKGLAWSQVLVVIAVHPALGAGASSLFLVATGLTLTLSVLESSYAMAYLDELTGLPARRALVNDLDALGGTYAVAMVDIDHFKKLNDTHGHDIGDEVLKLVATRLARAPGGGRAYRYGGEEFTLLYPGSTSDAARPHLDAVRKSIEDARFTLRAWNRPRTKPKDGRRKRRRRTSRLKVTVSLGVSHASGGGVAPEDVLKQADEALYRAKKGGRNRVSVWEGG